ncbi:zinc ribbon domain-containing protein [Deinococcus marmoris]|uniref:Cas12f1-like TNB domain-containing protein n=1 Tax=Deinococcus marmoris TaxID=249408 RepID=A0A1U7P0N5_9DEIO|nr:zinc ribbon domain-containing protein [Deinococcus marmoris]OLV17221.1 hypothetical protein BOO71_0009277 [Deinococcus marmoris]OLV18718.1 hypothetical protein BOO71_0005194 [Deinococcus marmoris]
MSKNKSKLAALRRSGEPPGRSAAPTSKKPPEYLQPTVVLTTPIHPSVDQAAQLHEMWRVLLVAQHALVTYLHHRAAGGAATLTAIASGQWHEGPPSSGSGPPDLTLRALDAEFRVARDALGWGQFVASSALRWMVAETAREWRLRRTGAEPGRWTLDRAVELHLDNSVQIGDPVTLSVVGVMGGLSADLFLPRAYWRAMIRRQRRRVEAEGARLDALERRWLDQGDGGAAAELFSRRARVGLRSALPDPGAPSDRDLVSRERVVFRHVPGAEGLPPRWAAQWAFDVADVPFPRWTQDDVIGVDLGYRYPFAVATTHQAALVPRPFRGDFAAPTLNAQQGNHLQPADLARARAEHRRSLFMRLLPIYEAQLALVLRHRVVALEQMAWGGFTRRGSRFASYAQDVGLLAWLDWVDALAPHHGVRVVKVQPAYTSRTCSRCGWVGARPLSGKRFCCVVCGYSLAADANAAAVIRARGQALLGGP